MAYPEYLRLRARELRVEKRLTLDELVERLALPRTTVYEWIKDLQLGKPRSTAGQAKRVAAMQAKYQRLRDEAYALLDPVSRRPGSGRAAIAVGSAAGIDGATIAMQRKSNSGPLTGRTWRSELGVLTVTVHDTALRSRLQAWIDHIKEHDWRLH